MFFPLFCMIIAKEKSPLQFNVWLCKPFCLFSRSASCQKAFLLDKAGFCSAFSVARHTIAQARMAGKNRKSLFIACNRSICRDCRQGHEKILSVGRRFAGKGLDHGNVRAVFFEKRLACRGIAAFFVKCLRARLRVQDTGCSAPFADTRFGGL